METSKRFDDAINKLYTAFNSSTLNPECCKLCAVGNILDNNDSWKHLSDHHGSTQLNYVGRVHQMMGRRFNGYTPLELLQIESAFLKGCGYLLTSNNRLYRPQNIKDQNILYHGLKDVISELCSIDGQNDVMDIAQLLKKSLAKKDNLVSPL